MPNEYYDAPYLDEAEHAALDHSGVPGVQSGASGAVDFTAGAVLENNDPATMNDFGGFFAIGIGGFTVYDSEWEQELADPDVLPTELGLAWETDAASGVLTAVEDGLWRVSTNVIFAQDATGIGVLHTDNGALPVGYTFHRAIDLSSSDSSLREVDEVWTVRLKALNTFAFEARVYGPTATIPAALCTYASFGIHRLA